MAEPDERNCSGSRNFPAVGGECMSRERKNREYGCLVRLSPVDRGGGARCLKSATTSGVGECRFKAERAVMRSSLE